MRTIQKDYLEALLDEGESYNPLGFQCDMCGGKLVHIQEIAHEVRSHDHFAVIVSSHHGEDEKLRVRLDKAPESEEELILEAQKLGRRHRWFHPGRYMASGTLTVGGK